MSKIDCPYCDGTHGSTEDLLRKHDPEEVGIEGGPAYE